MKKWLSLLLATSSLSALPPGVIDKNFCLQAPVCAPVKEMFVEVNGAKLFCRVLGKGEPVFVLHGGPGLSQNYLLPQLDKLAMNNLVVFYDQRGSGESIGGAEQISIKRFVEDLEDLRKALGFKKISVVGHSWGGLLGVEYAAAYPDNIKKLVLMNSMGATSEDYQLFLQEFFHRTEPLRDEITKLTQTQAFVEGNPETVAKHLKLLLRTYCANPKKADELSLQVSLKANIDGDKTLAVFQNTLFSKSFNFNPDLKKLACKTLIIHGEKDLIPFSAAKNLHENIRNSQIIVLKDCGHFPFVEKPDALFAELEQFLQAN